MMSQLCASASSSPPASTARTCLRESRLDGVRACTCTCYVHLHVSWCALVYSHVHVHVYRCARVYCTAKRFCWRELNRWRLVWHGPDPGGCQEVSRGCCCSMLSTLLQLVNYSKQTAVSCVALILMTLIGSGPARIPSSGLRGLPSLH